MRVWRLMCVATAVFGGLSASEAQAGLFDQLFGGSRRTPEASSVPEYLPEGIPFLPSEPSDELDRVTPDELRRRAAARKAADAARRAAAQQRSADQAARDKRLADQLNGVAEQHGAQAAFLLDPTLRKGDYVVTESGIRTFTGSTSSTHASADFQALKASGSKGRSDLLALQAVSGLNAPQSDIVVARSPRALTISRKRSAAASLSDKSGATGSPSQIKRSPAGEDGGQ